MQPMARMAVVALAVAALSAAPLAGCHRTSATGTPIPAGMSGASPTATMLFCAYGGVGLTPDPLPPGYETEFAAMAFQIDNPGPARSGVTVVGAALLDSTGATTASLRRLDHFVLLPALETPGPSLGIFAVYLNPPGSPFTGVIPHGRSQLRVRLSLDRAPSAPPARCHLELGGMGASPQVIEGKVDGSWPT